MPRPSPALEQLVLDQFPFPIAFGYKAMLAAESSAATRDNLIYTWSAAIRFSALVLLGEFLHGDRQVQSVARVVRRLRLPSLGDWHTVVRVLARDLFRSRAETIAEPFSSALLAGVRNVVAQRTRDGRPLLDAMVQFRNEKLGHGATTSEGELAELLVDPREWLATLLEQLRPLAELKPVRRLGSGEIVHLVGAEHGFRHEQSEDPLLENVLDQSPIALARPDGASVPLHPLAISLDPSPSGQSEPLALFDGQAGPRRGLFYMGVSSRITRKEEAEVWEALLRGKAIDPRFTKADLTPWRVSGWAREMTAAAIDTVRGVKYFPEAYQERHAHVGERLGVDDVVARWLDHGGEAALIVAAEAGAGKSSLLCHLAETLLADAAVGEREGADNAPSGDVVALVLAESIRGAGKARLFHRLRTALGFTDAPGNGLGSLPELLQAWRRVALSEDPDHEKRRLVFLIDAVNEAEDPKALLEELGALAAAASAANREEGRPFVRLVATVRLERVRAMLDRWGEVSDAPLLPHAECFAHFKDGDDVTVPYLRLRLFTPSEAEAAWERSEPGRPRCSARWDVLTTPTRDLLRHPLLMDLFRTAFAEVEHPPGIANESGLWDAWLDHCFDPRRSSGRLERDTLDLADECLSRGATGIPGEIVHELRQRWASSLCNDAVRMVARLDPVERLIDAGLVRRTESGGWDWRHDALAEQVYARALHRRDPEMSTDSLGEWCALPASPRLDGALIVVGELVWRADRAADLAVFGDAADGRGRRLIGAILVRVVPIARPDEVAARVDDFERDLDELARAIRETERLDVIAAFRDALVWDCAGYLERALGGGRFMRVVLELSARIAVAVASHEVGELRHLRALFEVRTKQASNALRSGNEAALGRAMQTLQVANEIARLAPNGTGDPFLAWALTLLADVEQSADVEGAYNASLKALEIRRAIAKSRPTADSLVNLALTYSRLAHLDSLRDPQTSKSWLDEEMRVLHELTSKDPDNPLYQALLCGACLGRGDLLARFEPAAARADYDSALRIAQSLRDTAPEDVENLRRLALVQLRVGDLLVEKEPEQARACYISSVETARLLTRFEPGCVEYHRDLEVACQRVGEADLRLGAPRRAYPFFRESLEIAGRLHQREPDNTKYMRDLATAFDRVGMVLSRVNEPERARDAFAHALRVARDLVEREPNTPIYLNDLVVALARVGDTAELREEALDAYRQAKSAAERLVALDPREVELLSKLRNLCGDD